MAIIIFDLALHMSIFIIHAEYFWCCDGSISERINKLHGIGLAQTLFYCKASSELVRVHSLLICVSSFN